VTISSQWLPTGNSTAQVVLIVGMAVGGDYSLFYLRREREEPSQVARLGGVRLTRSLRVVLVDAFGITLAVAHEHFAVS
jgi:putative drug exporter of the RND superfamily